jgi:NAD-dependent DNA ligase
MTEVQRATRKLHKILAGISADDKLSAAEITSLNNWLNANSHLRNIEPFQGAVLSLNRCLEDEMMDQEEREEILQWCLEFSDHLPGCVTVAVRRLHNILQEIFIGDLIKASNVSGLRNWLNDHEIFREYWPFCDTWHIVEHILEDGKIAENEKGDLKGFFGRFSKHVFDGADLQDEIQSNQATQADVLALQPFTALCDTKSDIKFSGNSFCFTGPARTGPRRALHEIVRNLKGIPFSRVARSLDYLVIGAQSSPCWAYSTYGRKIQEVIGNRRRGKNTIILHEDNFIEQAYQRGVW